MGKREEQYNAFLEKVKDKSVIRYLHSGDMGDIVSSLPVIKEMSETLGKKGILILDTTGGQTVNDGPLNSLITRNTNSRGLKFNHTSFEFIKPLLEVQPYIESVEEYTDGSKPPDDIDLNLNAFRYFASNPKLNEMIYCNLMYCHQLASNVIFGYKGPFLEVPDGNKIPARMIPLKKGIVSRSNRYHSSQVFLQTFTSMLHDFKFIGTDIEYEAFVDCISLRDRDQIPHVKVKNALEMAKLVKEAPLVFSNATLLYWIAVGLEKPIIHELNSSSYVTNTITPDYKKVFYIRNDKWLTFNPETGKIDLERTLQEFFDRISAKDEKK